MKTHKSLQPYLLAMPQTLIFLLFLVLPILLLLLVSGTLMALLCPQDLPLIIIGEFLPQRFTFYLFKYN